MFEILPILTIRALAIASATTGPTNSPTIPATVTVTATQPVITVMPPPHGGAEGFFGGWPNVWQGLIAALIGAAVALLVAKRTVRWTMAEQRTLTDVQLAAQREALEQQRAADRELAKEERAETTKQLLRQRSAQSADLLRGQLLIFANEMDLANSRGNVPVIAFRQVANVVLISIRGESPFIDGEEWASSLWQLLAVIRKIYDWMLAKIDFAESIMLFPEQSDRRVLELSARYLALVIDALALYSAGKPIAIMPQPPTELLAAIGVMPAHEEAVAH